MKCKMSAKEEIKIMNGRTRKRGNIQKKMIEKRWEATQQQKNTIQNKAADEIKWITNYNFMIFE